MLRCRQRSRRGASRGRCTTQARSCWDLARATALRGDCLADVAMVRAEPSLFGPVASDPTVSRLVDMLAAAGSRALAAIRTARTDVRDRTRQLAGPQLGV